MKTLGVRAGRMKTYGDVIEEYGYHPESTCADAGAQPSGRQTTGLGGFVLLRFVSI